MAEKSSKDLLEQIAKLRLENDKLQKQVAELRTKDLDDAEKDYKDRLFKFIFGNPENKQWTLSLYNAIGGTDYTNPDEIQFNTIEDVIYMRMKNDVSFLVAAELDMWEHQGSFNPNMPMRFHIYSGRLYEKWIATSDYYPYSSSLQKVPRPRCICFYNGTQEEPESLELKLSDAYEGEGDIEVKVTMLNINYGKNRELMEKCKPLYEYSWLVDAVRKNQKIKNDLDSAVDGALDSMPDDFVIKPFLIGHRAEVKNMLLTEYNEEKVMEKERKEGRQEGHKEERTSNITDLFKNGAPLDILYKTFGKEEVDKVLGQGA